MSSGIWSLAGPRNRLLDVGTHWRHLANTSEQSVLGGDGLSLPLYISNLFCFETHTRTDTGSSLTTQRLQNDELAGVGRDANY